MPDNVLCLGLVATLYPQARIILCRRDPRDVALSCFFQKFTPGMLGFSYDLADCGRRQVQIDRLLEHWRRVLTLPMLEVDYEKLVADLAGESQKLVSFLGLEWEPDCLEFHRTQRTVATAGGSAGSATASIGRLDDGGITSRTSRPCSEPCLRPTTVPTRAPSTMPTVHCRMRSSRH